VLVGRYNFNKLENSHNIFNQLMLYIELIL